MDVRLGNGYGYGLWGLRVDRDKAFELWSKAAELGSIASSHYDPFRWLFFSQYDEQCRRKFEKFRSMIFEKNIIKEFDRRQCSYMTINMFIRRDGMLFPKYLNYNGFKSFYLGFSRTWIRWNWRRSFLPHLFFQKTSSNNSVLPGQKVFLF